MSRRNILVFAAVFLFSIFFTACATGKNPSAKQTVTIVIGNEDNREVAELLQDKMGASVKIIDDDKESSSNTEILIGETSREKSKICSAGMREGDCWVRFYEGSIVIQGSTDDLLQKAVNYFIENHIEAWKNGDAFPTSATENYISGGNYSMWSVTFDQTNIFEYSIVTKDGTETEEALLLQEHIEAMSAYKLPIISSLDLKEGQKAIIFGSSEARKTSEKCETLEEKEFLIEVEEDSLYLCAWDESEERIVSYMFLGGTLSCDLYANKPESVTQVFEDYKFKFTTAFDGSGKFKAMCTTIAHFPVQEEFNILQGACTDGNYIYLVMEDRTYDSGTCAIVKVDPETWEVVQVSEALPLDHGNGITYLPDTNQLLVANCSPDPTLLSWVDAETLEFVKSEKMPYTVYSISWNQEKQQFAGYGMNKVMLMIDKDMNVTKSYNGLASTYTVQGYETSDDYVYIVSAFTNAIHVCDWEGHWIETIEIPVATEMQAMIEVNGLQYTCFMNPGADIDVTIFYRTLYQ